MFADDPFKYLQGADTFGKLHSGIGFEYQASDKLSVFLQGDYNFTFSDKIDNVVSGKRDDYYFNFNLGVNYKLGL
jgi:curli production assembly/transport component CsgG